MKLDLAGKVAVVTGGGRGIGRAICEALAGEGCPVAVCDRDEDAARDVAQAIVAQRGHAAALKVDVSDRSSVQLAATDVQRLLGTACILVNNAGFSLDGPLLEMTDEQWDAVVDVNLKGSWLCAQTFVPAMRAAGWGRIINISSRAHLGENRKSNYCAAKAGVIGLTRALSIELGDDNITVNAVAPGLIRTERVRSLRHFEDIDRRARESTPIKRPGTPEDVAAAVVYLASEAAAFVSGEVLHVTGGRYSST
jgi:3-oxoacyl-[acyl-carrier protein] reductase